MKGLNLFAKLSLILGGIILTSGAIALGAIISGVVLWYIWPYAIPVAFPGLVNSGAIAVVLPLKNAICLTWVFGILIKSTQTNKVKETKEVKTPKTTSIK